MSEHDKLAEARRFRETFEFSYLGGPMFALDGEALERAAREFDNRLAAALAAARAQGAAEAFERADLLCNRMLGNPEPGARPNVRDGASWKSACLRIQGELRALAREAAKEDRA